MPLRLQIASETLACSSDIPVGPFLDSGKFTLLSQPGKHFDLIIEVRNEIVHPVPFGTGMPWNVPGDLLELHEKGILMTTGKHDAEYSFNDKIRSYALAYWSWEVIESAVALVIEHVEADQVISWTAQNFSQYRSICPPKDLPGYDASQRN